MLAERLILEEPTHPSAAQKLPLIVELAGQWERLHAEAEAAWSEAGRANEAAGEIIPPIQLPEGMTRGFPLNRDDLAQRDHADRQAGFVEPQSSPRVEAYDRWCKQYEAILGYYRIEELEKAADEIQRQANALADRIRTLRPSDAYSAARKFRVLRARFTDGEGGFDDVNPIHAFQDDLDFLASMANPIRDQR